ncbi:cyclase family protein [candidate division KSB1 bacterium]
MNNSRWVIRGALVLIILTYIGYSRFYTNNDPGINSIDQTGLNIIISIRNIDSELKRFVIGVPFLVDRRVLFMPETRASGSFFLPEPSRETFEVSGQFTGDVDRGGVCNVEVISSAAHNLTHIETSAHVLSYGSDPFTVDEIPPENLSGLLYLIDLTDIPAEAGRAIEWSDIKERLDGLTLPVTMLAIKTGSSLMEEDHNFSGEDFLCLSPEAAEGINNFRIMVNRIGCLILDLPSIDRENDEGKLLAHRKYFGIPETGHSGADTEKRALVELAYFSGLDEGYYYAVITPARFQTNAVTTGITFWKLNEEK